MRGYYKAFLMSVYAFMVLACSDEGNLVLKTKYLELQIDTNGFVSQIVNLDNGVDYVPPGRSSALIALEKDGEYIYPQAVDFKRDKLTLTYPNGSVATVLVKEKKDYLRFELQSLEPRNDVDNIIWGPYKTTIRKTIGDMLSVVRDGEYAVGILALDDNTTSGLPCPADMHQGAYIIHSPDLEKYPIPDSLREGQRFRIGGDGINDVAFFSHPEEYYRFLMGNGAVFEPEYGSFIVLHSRDRKKPQTILYPHFNDFPSVKAPRHMDVAPVDIDYIGSAIAFYGCPDDLGLNVIEKIVLSEGLPHPTINGIWIKDPRAYKPDIAWLGREHDSLVAYAVRLRVKGVQDEALGEYYVNPADRWAGKKVSLDGERLPITELTKELNKHGVDYGLHTLCEFVQPHSSHVTPEANDSLCTVLRTTILNDLSVADTLIRVADTSYLNERGVWDDNGLNVLKIGSELLHYTGVTTTEPYTLTGVKRGAYKTIAKEHKAGDTIAKLQGNCYGGFIPDINLQDKYAAFYAKLLVDGGMNYIDFDGFESCNYQGHGHYSFKRFCRVLFDKFKEYGGDFPRVMGSSVYEGNWHYMSVCNIGGGNHMFNPHTNQWGIEGKDIRYAYRSSYFPCTFGIQYMGDDWTARTIENLQSKAVAWDATYMLGISQDRVERNPHKEAMFNTFRTWELAREANVFPKELKIEMRDSGNFYHLEQTTEKSWKLYKVLPDNKLSEPIVLK